jgi:putative transposase
MDAIKGIVNKVARREKIPRHGVSTELPTQSPHRHHVWSWDLIFDRTDNEESLKMMTLLDEYSRQSLAIQV